MRESLYQDIIVPLGLFIGTFKLIALLFGLIGYVNRQWLRVKKNHLSRYGGKGTWALVNGATDGVGFEFCRQLAAEGFNICLIAHDDHKLEHAEEDLKEDLFAQQVETRIIEVEYSNNAKMSYFENLMEQVKDLDIGLYVLNAGRVNAQFVLKVEADKLQDMLDVNAYSCGAMLKLFEQKLLQRGKPGGIIVTSNIGAQFFVPANFTYCASKAFVKYIAQAVHWENKKAGTQIDVMALQPHFVNGLMIQNDMANGFAFGQVPAEDCVSAALRDLGHEATTYGASLHERIGFIMTFVMNHFMPGYDRSPLNSEL